MTTSATQSKPQLNSTPLADLGQIWIDGNLVPAAEAAVSVMDHGVLYGDGVFEGIRSYGGRVMKLRTHMKRLYESAKAIRLEIPYQIEVLEQAVRDTLAANDRADGYVRLCITRGVGSMGLNPFLSPHPTVFIITCDIQLYPQELYDNGMPIITCSVTRNHAAALSPRIKSNNYLNNILAKIEAIDAGVQEAVMLNTQGNVAECTGDNLFIVKNGKLFTPPLSAGILEGITRNLVIELAEKIGFKVIQADLTKHDLYTADECFLTGSAAEVIPVSEVDKRAIGPAGDTAGKPGPITLQLIKAFRDLIADGVPED